MKEKEPRKPILSVTKKDCKWDYFKATGAGGQKKNKTSSAVRCTHIDSGAVGQCTEHRSQLQNKKLAFRRMADTIKFKNWIKVETSRRLGREVEIERDVEKAMHSKNLRVETKDENGRWVENNDIKEESSAKHINKG